MVHFHGIFHYKPPVLGTSICETLPPNVVAQLFRLCLAHLSHHVFQTGHGTLHEPSEKTTEALKSMGK